MPCAAACSATVTAECELCIGRIEFTAAETLRHDIGEIDFKRCQPPRGRLPSVRIRRGRDQEINSRTQSSSTDRVVCPAGRLGFLATTQIPRVRAVEDDVVMAFPPTSFERVVTKLLMSSPPSISITAANHGDRRFISNIIVSVSYFAAVDRGGVVGSLVDCAAAEGMMAGLCRFCAGKVTCGFLSQVRSARARAL